MPDTRHLPRYLALAAILACGVPAQAAMAQSAAAVDESVARVTVDLHWLADDAREGRGVGTDGLEAAAEYIARAFADAGLVGSGPDGFYQPFEISPTAPGVAHTNLGGSAVKNVIGLLPGRGALASQVVVLGAHYDHLGYGIRAFSLDPDSVNVIHNGADDNASGTAGLLEIAQYLADLKAQGRLGAKRDILFAAWSGEEMGTLGSSHFAKTLAEALGAEDGGIGGAVAAYLNMDMIGRLEESLYLQGTGSSPAWTREIERRNVPLGLSIVTSDDSYLPTDATPLYLKGVPVLNAFTGPHTDYSTPRDTADKLNYPGAEKIARLMAGIARSLARAEAAPTYVRLERPKDSIGRKHIRIYLGTIPDYAQGEGKGVKLSGTIKGGPAEKAGLEGGDVILGLGGAEIGNIYDYVNMLGGLKADTPVEIVIERDGARKTLTIVPAAKE